MSYCWHKTFTKTSAQDLSAQFCACQLQTHLWPLYIKSFCDGHSGTGNWSLLTDCIPLTFDIFLLALSTAYWTKKSICPLTIFVQQDIWGGERMFRFGRTWMSSDTNIAYLILWHAASFSLTIPTLRSQCFNCSKRCAYRDSQWPFRQWLVNIGREVW